VSVILAFEESKGNKLSRPRILLQHHLDRLLIFFEIIFPTPFRVHLQVLNILFFLSPVDNLLLFLVSKAQI